MGRNLAEGMHQAAGAAVLAVGLAQAVAQRHFPVELPQRLARGDLDGDDDVGCARQRLAAVDGGADAHLRTPGVVHALGHAGGVGGAPGVQVNQD